MAHKDENEELLNPVVNDAENPETRAPATFAPADSVLAERQEDKGTAGQLELLAMEDIYRMAGILNPRKAYRINNITEMLNSEHLRGLSKEMKRASVLMALDAAGVTIEEVLQDAKARQDVIDSYEADQRRQFEAQLARKAEENTQIQAELERVKARPLHRAFASKPGWHRAREGHFWKWANPRTTRSAEHGQSGRHVYEGPRCRSTQNATGRSQLRGSTGQARVSVRR
jgi:hypothetical protein